MISLFGEVRLSCSYYHCRHCHTGYQPWDEALRLGERRVTAGAEEAIALAGLLTSFGQAARNTLVKLTGIRVSESTVQRVTEDVGEKLGERLAAKETFGPARPWSWQKDQVGRTCAYTSLDFVSVPQQGPQGAKADSRMAAVAMIYDPQPEQNERPPASTARGGCPVRFLSGLYELDELGLELRRQAAQVGWDEAQQQLALSDAGNGLEDFAFRNFPLAEPILDFYHASEHVTALAKACHPEDAAGAEEQTSAWCHQLKHQGGAALLGVWEQLKVGRWGPARREVYRQEVQYFRNHLDLTLNAARGPNQAIEEFLRIDEIICRQCIHLLLEQVLKLKDRFLNLAIDYITGRPILKQPLNPLAKRFIGRSA